MSVMHSKRWATISNFLSLVRLLLGPVVAWALLGHRWAGACVLFALGSVTDLLDGYLARQLHEQTIVGQYLDPIADKVFLIASFATLAYVRMATVGLPAWFIWIVFVREVLILGGGAVLISFSVGDAMAPSWWGKWTTAGYMLIIMWLFLCFFVGWMPARTFNAALILVAGVACISLLHYYWRGWMLIRSGNRARQR